MKQLIFILLCICFFCGCAMEPSTTQENLPLAIGNQWRFARALYLRGSIIDRDTLEMTIINELNGSYSIRRSSPRSIDTFAIKKIDAENYVDSNGSVLLGLTISNPSSLLLPILAGSFNVRTSFDRISDTTFDGLSAKRIHQSTEFRDDMGNIVLRVAFDHYYVPGAGPVAVRFVADIRECLVCSLLSEFWTYELIDRDVR